MNTDKIRSVSHSLKLAKEELKNMLPAHLQFEFESEAYISGGCIYSLYNNEEPKDYDFFLRTRALTDKIRSFFMGLIIHDNPFDEAEEEVEKNIYVVHYNGNRILITKNAISFGKKYQIITKYIGDPKEVVNEFDFKHNMFYYYNDEVQTLSQWDFLDKTQLYYNENRARDISGTIIRIHKFCERGMTISNKEVAKMLKKLRDVGFTERENEIIDGNGSY